MSAPVTENYLLIVCGIADFLSGWQRFKDSLRKIVRDQPGWTEVIDDRPKRQKQGWCRLDRKEDAEAAYLQYSQHRGILVHLFKTSRSGANYQMLKCNCGERFDTSDGAHSPTRSGLDVVNVNQVAARAVSGSNTAVYTTSTTSAYWPGYTQIPQYPAPTHSTPVYGTYAPPIYGAPPYGSSPYAASSTQSYYGAPAQQMSSQYVYPAGSAGMPVRVTEGAVLTEARGIFLGNLSYDIKPHHLVELLSSAGCPVDSRLHRDTKTGQFKGNATAQYATKEEAQYAVTKLNGAIHMNKKIHVRLDTEKTPVREVQGPLIVNGTNVPRS